MKKPIEKTIKIKDINAAKRRIKSITEELADIRGRLLDGNEIREVSEKVCYTKETQLNHLQFWIYELGKELNRW